MSRPPRTRTPHRLTNLDQHAIPYIGYQSGYTIAQNALYAFHISMLTDLG